MQLSTEKKYSTQRKVCLYNLDVALLKDSIYKIGIDVWLSGKSQTW